MRGADSAHSFSSPTTCEPSPRARGRPCRGTPHALMGGTIPACAGPTRPAPTAWCSAGNHPRMRGADNVLSQPPPAFVEPSPRARGRRDEHRDVRRLYRTIPACAGPTGCTCLPTPSAANHPRVRGADLRMEIVYGWYVEPSPRAQGRLGRGAAVPELRGTIPACAGPTRGDRAGARPSPNHPRVRGADPESVEVDCRRCEPSPRARGRQLTGFIVDCYARTIPACAGPTSRSTWLASPRRNHPRVRGADVAIACVVVGLVEPSPRARGRLGLNGVVPPVSRTIPACAGPTCAARSRREWSPEPSPRARGRLLGSLDGAGQARTIPACAGPTR